MPPSVGRAECKLKGVNFIGTLGALERRRGADVARSVIAQLPGEVGEALRTKALLTSGWYPSEWYRTLLGEIAKLDRDGPSFVRQLSRDAVVHDLATIFKVLSFVVSAEYALKNSVKIASRYVDGGKIGMLESRAGFVRLRFDEFWGYDHLMWNDWVGGMQATVEMMRVKNVACEIVAGGRDGDDFAEVTVSWTQ